MAKLNKIPETLKKELYLNILHGLDANVDAGSAKMQIDWANTLTDIVVSVLEGRFQVRDIPGFPNYCMDDKGSVRNKKTGEYLATSASGGVRMRKDGKIYHRSRRKMYSEIFPRQH